MSYQVLGVAAGNGVSLYPFKDQVIGNIEPRAIFHSVGDKQWKANFPDAFMDRAKGKLPKVKPQVIISSPDCGSGSILRLSVAKEYGDIKENKSFNLWQASIHKYKPDFFYFENLPGIFKSLPKEWFITEFSRYNLTFHEASVSRWGNSQIHRVRLVIIGCRKDLNCNWERLFKLPDRGDEVKTCWELYGDLDDDTTPRMQNGHAREPMRDQVTVFSKFKCSIRECQAYWLDNPKLKRWQVTGRKFSNAPGVYRNRKNDYPATARKANRQFDHNGFMLSPRQLARIQGVPDDFKIYMDDKLKYWINKGRASITKTPPYEVSVWFKQKLNKYYGSISNGA